MQQKWKPEVKAEVLLMFFEKSICRLRILQFIRKKHFGLYRIAGLLLWAVISMRVMVAEISISYNSCRNRHCPGCQGHKREEWIQKREAELLPFSYYHVVFTLPEELNGLVISQRALLYKTLFEASWATLNQFGKTEQMQLGMIAILHTWGQNLSLHPHLHCIVPGGGIDHNGKWKKKVRTDKYLFCVKAMSKVFRAKFVASLRVSGIKDQHLMDQLFTKNWVVYAKKPFAGPKQVIEYLGRYTHKVATCLPAGRSAIIGSKKLPIKKFVLATKIIAKRVRIKK